MDKLRDFEEILLSFTKENVEFMLCGGFAVNFHGYNRSTSDLDIWVKPNENNKTKIISALLKIGYPKESENLIGNLNFLQPFVFSLGLEPIDVDIFNHITGVEYNDADKNKISFQYNEALIVHYISVKDLIINKMLTGRPQDKADVEYLQKIEQLKKNK
jgi:hypothetical protein